jgi:dihydrofolate synthase/folylpolyglutamate synthase
VSVADEIAEVASKYPRLSPRSSLDAVVQLRQALPLQARPPAVGVVGTNGKTSTATYLARLLSARGHRTGLYVSPHITEWGERIRIDDAPCDSGELLAALRLVDELAQSGSGPAGELRFFDLLTLAAELVFSRAEVGVAVYEAGIGGRLDAISTLRPGLLLLTGVALDHTEILGESRAEILREKLLAAPSGATAVSFPLGSGLDELAGTIAAEHGFRIVWADPEEAPRAGSAQELPAYLRLSLALAEVGSLLADEALPLPPASPAPGGASGEPIDLWLPGRFECGSRGAVPYVLDAAHNEAAWEELAAEMSRRFGGADAVPLTALVSVSPGKRREGLAAALRSMPGFEDAIVTRHAALPAVDPGEVAGELRLAGVDAQAVEDSVAAAALAFERAASREGRVVVFGSTYLVADVRHQPHESAFGRAEHG